MSMTNPNHKHIDNKPPLSGAHGTHAAGSPFTPPNAPVANPKDSPKDPNVAIPVEHLDDAEHPEDVAHLADLNSVTNSDPPNNPRGVTTDTGVVIKDGVPTRIQDAKANNDKAGASEKKPGAFTAGSDKKENKDAKGKDDTKNERPPQKKQ